MGGVDKGLVEWCGLPMAERVCQQLRPLVSELIVSCNRNPERYAAFCDRTVCDPVAGYPGPLAGILEGLRDMRGTHLVVIPCDLPAIDMDLLIELQQLALRHPDRVAVVRQGARPQPLVCVLPRTVLAPVEAAWEAGERSPGRLWQRLGASELVCSADDSRLINFNCPKILAAVASQPEQGLWRGYADHR
jgi:molybdopterin-guanine dinucleotide biosynthesis protein A